MRRTATPTSVRVDQRPEGLVVSFDERPDPLVLPWLWVRDHSEDPTSLDPASTQRLVDTFDLLARPPDVPTRVEADDDAVRVHWADGSPSAELSWRLLHDMAGLAPRLERRLWDSANPLGPVARVPYDRLMAGDDGVREWLTSVAEIGFGLVEGMPPDRERTEAVARTVAYPRSSIFGAMWSLSAALTDHSDSAYSQTYLEPHTDGTYVHDAPGLQMFACLEREGTGGQSILVDGFAAAERLREKAPDHFRILTEVAVPGQYLEPGVHLRTERPTIGLNADGSLRIVSFNNYDRAPFVLPPEQLAAWYEAYRAFHAEIVDRSHWQLVLLDPGDVLLFDNWRTLHGRMEYTGTRVFEGCYHNHEDFESRLRVLGVASQA